MDKLAERGGNDDGAVSRATMAALAAGSPYAATLAAAANTSSLLRQHLFGGKC